MPWKQELANMWSCITEDFRAVAHHDGTRQPLRVSLIIDRGASTVAVSTDNIKDLESATKWGISWLVTNRKTRG